MAAHDPIAVVRAFFEAWNRRDEEALRALCHPEVEVRSALLASEDGDGRRRGRDAALEVYRNNVATLGFTFELRDTLAYGELVLAVVDNSARTRGLELGREYGMVFEVRDGLVIRALTYFDFADALVAMGALVGRAGVSRRSA